MCHSAYTNYFSDTVTYRFNRNLLKVRAVITRPPPISFHLCSRRTRGIRHCSRTMHFPNTYHVITLAEARLHAAEKQSANVAGFDGRNLSNTKSISELTRWKKCKYKFHEEYSNTALFQYFSTDLWIDISSNNIIGRNISCANTDLGNTCVIFWRI